MTLTEGLLGCIFVMLGFLGFTLDQIRDAIKAQTAVIEAEADRQAMRDEQVADWRKADYIERHSGTAISLQD
jgi:hypothetical protein